MTGGKQEKSPERTLEGTFYFDPDDAIYRDHFPGYPVVPGSVIVCAFLNVAGVLGFSGEKITVEHFRFREFLSPGLHPFRIEDRGNILVCTIVQNNKKVVTGMLSK